MKLKHIAIIGSLFPILFSLVLFFSIGILVMPIINLISHSELGYYIGLILIVVGVFYIIFIIVKYNGKLISFKK